MSSRLWLPLCMAFVWSQVLGTHCHVVVEEANATSSLRVISPPPRNCYSAENGRFIQMAATDCATQPCLLSTNQLVTVQATFSPARNTNSLKHYLSYRKGGGNDQKYVSYGNIAGNFYSGTEYNVTRTFSIPPEFQKTHGVFDMELMDHLDGYYFIRRCFDARFSDSAGRFQNIQNGPYYDGNV